MSYNTDEILEINSQLLKDKSSLKEYINLLKQKGIDNNTIIEALTYKEECIDILKNDIELFQVVFENVTPTNLDEFFNKFFSEKELEQFLTNSERLQGNILKVSQLYIKDKTVLSSLNGKLLGEQYENIDVYKMQIIAKDPKFQNKILGLNDFGYSLYSQMTQLVAQKTHKWNRFDQNIVDNLSDGYYDELINDLYEQVMQGEELTSKEIETLTYLFSKEGFSKSFLGEEYSNNIFNITSRAELQHFKEIKRLVCDTVLTNPSLDNEQLTGSISKYLGKFTQLSELDRMKLALLQKYYNVSLEEATNIVERFSTDIDNISVNDQYQGIVEQITAIKKIIKSNDVSSLNQISDLGIFTETDLSSSTYLQEETKDMFEQLYKEQLYMPKPEEKIGETIYKEKRIDIFEANTGFNMIVKRVGASDGNSQEIWNSLTTEYNEKKMLRYNTCVSHMTDENLLYNYEPNPLIPNVQVILGFAQSTESYSFEAIYTSDSCTPMAGDRVYKELYGATYITPSTLDANTKGEYNELIINTLGVDEKGQVTKMQPDYVVYIKNQSNIEDLDYDPMWENTKKIASEFGIPIVVVDREKVKQSEKAKIEDMSQRIQEKPNIKEILRFVKKVKHYESRYGMESILEYAPKDKMDFFKQYSEETQESEEKLERLFKSWEEGCKLRKKTD